MGIAELDEANMQLILHADIFLYGDAASQSLAADLANDITSHWNAPNGIAEIKNVSYRVVFNIEATHAPDLIPQDIYENDNAAYNYFRIEEFVHGNISFVDGVNSNTGYFKLENLINNSTTAAHEFGHTLGLDHPEMLDIRGGNIPGIMYPRGTIVDPHFQYDPTAAPQTNGGTLNPYYRQVLQQDIDNLRLNKLRFNENGLAMVGNFSSVWHDKHLPL